MYKILVTFNVLSFVLLNGFQQGVWRSVECSWIKLAISHYPTGGSRKGWVQITIQRSNPSIKIFVRQRDSLECCVTCGTVQWEKNIFNTCSVVSTTQKTYVPDTNFDNSHQLQILKSTAFQVMMPTRLLKVLILLLLESSFSLPWRSQEWVLYVVLSYGVWDFFYNSSEPTFSSRFVFYSSADEFNSNSITRPTRILWVTINKDCPNITESWVIVLLDIDSSTESLKWNESSEFKWFKR